MAFSGYVAWKLTDAADLLEGNEPEPVVPALAADGANQDQVDAATELLDAWRRRNKQLYGLLVQAIPDWLRTSVYNAHRNDGLAAIEHLRGSFDANDANDHAACVSRLSAPSSPVPTTCSTSAP